MLQVGVSEYCYSGGAWPQVSRSERQPSFYQATQQEATQGTSSKLSQGQCSHLCSIMRVLEMHATDDDKTGAERSL